MVLEVYSFPSKQDTKIAPTKLNESVRGDVAAVFQVQLPNGNLGHEDHGLHTHGWPARLQGSRGLKGRKRRLIKAQES